MAQLYRTSHEGMLISAIKTLRQGIKELQNELRAAGATRTSGANMHALRREWIIERWQQILASPEALRPEMLKDLVESVGHGREEVIRAYTSYAHHRNIKRRCQPIWVGTVFLLYRFLFTEVFFRQLTEMGYCPIQSALVSVCAVCAVLTRGTDVKTLEQTLLMNRHIFQQHSVVSGKKTQKMQLFKTHVYQYVILFMRNHHTIKLQECQRKYLK